MNVCERMCSASEASICSQHHSVKWRSDMRSGWPGSTGNTREIGLGPPWLWRRPSGDYPILTPARIADHIDMGASRSPHRVRCRGTRQARFVERPVTSRVGEHCCLIHRAMDGAHAGMRAVTPAPMESNPTTRGITTVFCRLAITSIEPGMNHPSFRAVPYLRRSE